MEQTKMEQTKNVVLTLNIKDDTSSDIELPKLKTDSNQKIELNNHLDFKV